MNYDLYIIYLKNIISDTSYDKISEVLEVEVIKENIYDYEIIDSIVYITIVPEPNLTMFTMYKEK